MHELEQLKDGSYSMAYAGELPWHGLGNPVSNDLTPEQMLKAASLDWEVNKVPSFILINDEPIYTGQDALVRSSDNSILDMVSTEWNDVSNLEAFQFFKEYVEAGEMNMETAGSLQNGRIVWAMAR